MPAHPNSNVSGIHAPSTFALIAFTSTLTLLLAHLAARNLQPFVATSSALSSPQHAPAPPPVQPAPPPPPPPQHHPYAAPAPPAAAVPAPSITIPSPAAISSIPNIVWIGNNGGGILYTLLVLVLFFGLGGVYLEKVDPRTGIPTASVGIDIPLDTARRVRRRSRGFRISRRHRHRRSSPSSSSSPGSSGSSDSSDTDSDSSDSMPGRWKGKTGKRLQRMCRKMRHAMPSAGQANDAPTSRKGKEKEKDCERTDEETKKRGVDDNEAAERQKKRWTWSDDDVELAAESRRRRMHHHTRRGRRSRYHECSATPLVLVSDLYMHGHPCSQYGQPSCTADADATKTNDQKRDLDTEKNAKRQREREKSLERQLDECREQLERSLLRQRDESNIVQGSSQQVEASSSSTKVEDLTLPKSTADKGKVKEAAAEKSEVNENQTTKQTPRTPLRDDKHDGHQTVANRREAEEHGVRGVDERQSLPRLNGSPPPKDDYEGENKADSQKDNPPVDVAKEESDLSAAVSLQVNEKDETLADKGHSITPAQDAKGAEKVKSLESNGKVQPVPAGIADDANDLHHDQAAKAGHTLTMGKGKGKAVVEEANDDEEGYDVPPHPMPGILSTIDPDQGPSSSSGSSSKATEQTETTKTTTTTSKTTTTTQAEADSSAGSQAKASEDQKASESIKVEEEDRKKDTDRTSVQSNEDKNQEMAGTRSKIKRIAQNIKDFTIEKLAHHSSSSSDSETEDGGDKSKEGKDKKGKATEREIVEKDESKSTTVQETKGESKKGPQEDSRSTTETSSTAEGAHGISKPNEATTTITTETVMTETVTTTKNQEEKDDTKTTVTEENEPSQTPSLLLPSSKSMLYFSTASQLAQDFPVIVEAEAKKVHASLNDQFDTGAERLQLNVDSRKNEKPHQDGVSPDRSFSFSVPTNGRGESGQDAMLRALKYVRQSSTVPSVTSSSNRTADDVLLALINALMGSSSSTGIGGPSALETTTSQGDTKQPSKDPSTSGSRSKITKVNQIEDRQALTFDNGNGVRDNPVEDTKSNIATYSGSTNSATQGEPERVSIVMPATLSVDAVRPTNASTAEALKKHEASIRSETARKVKEEFHDLKQNASQGVSKIVGVLKRKGNLSGERKQDEDEVQREQKAFSSPSSPTSIFIRSSGDGTRTLRRRNSNVRFNPELSIKEIAARSDEQRFDADAFDDDKASRSEKTTGKRRQDSKNEEARVPEQEQDRSTSIANNAGASNEPREDGSGNVYERIRILTRRLSEI